jgi:hypothetical protein
MRKITLFLLAAIAVFAAAPASAAQLGDKVELHGFASWAYGETDGAHYQFGSDEGEYSHATFHLNINAKVTEKLTISAQVGFVQEHEGETGVDFDYAFADWKINDQARFRLGRVKHPFGIYGEILDVGTLRPFLSLPLGLYGPQGFVGKGYNGLGLTGSRQMANGWGMQYDLYGGQLTIEDSVPSLLVFAFLQDPRLLSDEVLHFEAAVNDVFGARLEIATPVIGLKFGLSGYTGTQGESEALTSTGGKQEFLGAHVEYLSNALLIRAEYVDVSKAWNPEWNIDTDVAYGEVAYTFKEHWQVAARYDYSQGHLPPALGSQAPPIFMSNQKHRDVAFGLNYWLNPNFVLKLSYHMVDGGKYAFPELEDPIAVLMGAPFDDETKAIQFGGQFSF